MSLLTWADVLSSSLSGRKHLTPQYSVENVIVLDRT